MVQRPVYYIDANNQYYIDANGNRYIAEYLNYEITPLVRQAYIDGKKYKVFINTPNGLIYVKPVICMPNI